MAPRASRDLPSGDLHELQGRYAACRLLRRRGERPRSDVRSPSAADHQGSRSPQLHHRPRRPDAGRRLRRGRTPRPATSRWPALPINAPGRGRWRRRWSTRPARSAPRPGDRADLAASDVGGADRGDRVAEMIDHRDPPGAHGLPSRWAKALTQSTTGSSMGSPAASRPCVDASSAAKARRRRGRGRSATASSAMSRLHRPRSAGAASSQRYDISPLSGARSGCRRPRWRWPVVRCRRRGRPPHRRPLHR